MSKSCGTCLFAEPTIIESGPVVRCHRNPPATLEEHPEPIETIDGEVVSATVTFDRYPIVRADDWCGEWRQEGPSDFAGVTVQQVLPGSIVTMPASAGMTPADIDDVYTAIRMAVGHEMFTIVWVNG